MNAERWERVVALFEEALSLPADARETFLADAARGDAELRRQVRAMLEADGGEGGILDGSAMAVARSLGPGDGTPEGAGDAVAGIAAGRRVGPYRIVGELGRGGMGFVYRARRDDVGLDVALKVVSGTLAAPDRLKRFEAERRFLARLEHPSIARLLDAGVLPDGTPWFAMELVLGLPLDRHCDERELGAKARLRLLDRVAAAVEYAHRRFILHRDLKPANILVTEGGTPKLLDFGVAKLLDEDEPDAAAMTRAGARLMTPEFAAPEQVAGEPVTSASDVYSLGMILYRLLSGEAPYTLGGSSAAAERRILEAHIRPPSEVAAPGSPFRGLSRDRARDLDALVLRALERDPERRYASAEQLRADIAAFLEHRPVSARRPTRWYRFARLVRRNRGAAAVAAGGLLLVTTFAGAMALERAATARERDRARVEAATAERVGAFLEGLFEASDPYGGVGGDTPVREILLRGRQQLAGLDETPEVRARLEHSLGRVHFALGEYEAAEALFAAALGTRRALFGPSHPDVAESERGLSRVHSLRGSLDSAEVLLDRARRSLVAAGAVDDIQNGELAMELGTILYRRADYPGAEAAYREALALYETALPHPELRIAQAQANLGNALSAQRRLSEAERHNRAAVATFRSLPGDQSANLAQAYNNLGVTLERLGRLAEAEAVQREALEAKRAYLPEGHNSIGVTLTNLGSVLTRTGRLAEAERLLLEAFDLQIAAMGPNHRFVTNALTELANVETARGAHDRALAHLDDARSRLLASVPPDDPRVATLLLHRASVLRALDDPRGAEAHARRAVEIREAALGADAAQTRAARAILAELTEELERGGGG